MSIGISDFVGNFQSGGYRPNLYRVEFLQRPAIMQNSIKTSYLCKSASLPPSNIGLADVNYMGRKIKIAGDRDFPSWTTSFYEDLDMVNRQSFERWSSYISSHESNVGYVEPLKYYADIRLHLLSHENGKPFRTYTLINAFPTEIGEIDLAYDANDTIGEFSVTWEYNYWTVSDPTIAVINDSAFG